eukprot:scaffold13406_cov29-Tisochrysis_lutea.AAC.3
MGPSVRPSRKMSRPKGTVQAMLKLVCRQSASPHRCGPTRTGRALNRSLRTEASLSLVSRWSYMKSKSSLARHPAPPPSPSNPPKSLSTSLPAAILIPPVFFDSHSEYSSRQGQLTA